MRFSSYKELDKFVEEICNNDYVSPFTSSENYLINRGYTRLIQLYNFEIAIKYDVILLRISNADIPIVITFPKKEKIYHQDLIKLLKKKSKERMSITITNLCEALIYELEKENMYERKLY